MVTGPRRAAVATGLVALALGACTAHVHYPLQSRGALPVSRTPPLPMFEYPPSPAGVRLSEPEGRAQGYTTRRLSMPASFESGQPGNRITGTFYASDAAGRKPLAIVLPVWGVSEYPSTKMTRVILKRSDGAVNVLRINGENRLMPWKRIRRSRTRAAFIGAVSNAAKRLRHAVIDTRRLIDWAQARPEVDEARIAVVGFSISAVTGTLVMQSDPRVRSSALVMGGAEVHRIVSECPGNEQAARRAVMERLNLSRGAYERAIAAAFEGLDPTDYPRRVDPRRVLLVDAARDDCIPARSREAWWRSLGRPERISMDYSHRGAFLAMTPLGFNFLTRRVYQHLAETL